MVPAIRSCQRPLPTRPDFVHRTLNVGGGNVTVTVRFASGTLTPSMVATIQLDIDPNPAIGFNDTAVAWITG